MAKQFGKIQYRNLADEVKELFSARPKSGAIGYNDLDKDLKDRLDSLKLVHDDKDAVYVDYNDEPIKNDIKALDANKASKADLESLRKKDEKISLSDLDDSTQKLIEAGGGTAASQKEIDDIKAQVDANKAGITKIQDQVNALNVTGPTRSIVKFLYIAKTSEDVKTYKAAKLSPIYRLSDKKVYKLHFKTTETEIHEIDDTTDTSGKTTDSDVDDSDTKQDSSTTTTTDTSATTTTGSGTADTTGTTNPSGSTGSTDTTGTTTNQKKVYLMADEPSDAGIGDMWLDTDDESLNDDEKTIDNDVYDELYVTNETWTEVSGGLLNREFARCLIYDPFRRGFYYCAYGELVQLPLAADRVVHDYTIPSQQEIRIEDENPYTKELKILIYNENNEAPNSYHKFVPAKDTDFYIYYDSSSITIKNLHYQSLQIKVIY